MEEVYIVCVHDFIFKLRQKNMMLPSPLAFQFSDVIKCSLYYYVRTPCTSLSYTYIMVNSKTSQRSILDCPALTVVCWGQCCVCEREGGKEGASGFSIIYITAAGNMKVEGYTTHYYYICSIQVVWKIIVISIINTF